MTSYYFTEVFHCKRVARSQCIDKHPTIQRIVCSIIVAVRVLAAPQFWHGTSLSSVTNHADNTNHATNNASERRGKSELCPIGEIKLCRQPSSNFKILGSSCSIIFYPRNICRGIYSVTSSSSKPCPPCYTEP